MPIAWNEIDLRITLTAIPAQNVPIAGISTFYF